jgi:hypothetical protein
VVVACLLVTARMAGCGVRRVRHNLGLDLLAAGRQPPAGKILVDPIADKASPARHW